MLNKVIINYMKERSFLWFDANKLSVNDEKTEEIVFSLSSKVDSKSVKLLGINLDSKLNWWVHINSLCSRLSRVIFLLKKLKSCTSKNLVMNAYFAFFNAHITYGTLLWGNSAGAKLVFKTQRRALRVIAGIGERDSCRPVFVDLGILTLPCIFILQSLIFLKENLNLYKFRSYVHNYSTRSQNLIDLKYFRLSKTQNSYMYISVKLFNLLPPDAVTTTLRNFRSCLVKWLKQKAFYSVEEILLHDLSDLKF
ncbi:hypothetical protein J6590_108669 [Homalodisca vitripennis]|nr:hypothetical protein J6590_108669 [Homalodisca vitripennis]